MKLFILTCLVAIVLASPKLPLRHPELNKDKLENSEEAIRKELSEEHVITDAELESSNNLSSEKVAPINSEKHISQEELYRLNLEQILRLNKYNLLQLEAVRAQDKLCGVNKYNHFPLREPMRVENQPFQHFHQLDVYSYAACYYPQQIMPFTDLPIHEISKPIAFEDIENADTVLLDW
ncbi:alpha-S1-casein-like [Choloepus didactylus]|uniref:alpha-S1-casein-like n=1 Tax=Choloepus didactylus TaxID=27675 RepID=UPI0018A0A5DE|nr:alpha-S1-casein-like [Choloepus didactylus]